MRYLIIILLLALGVGCHALAKQPNPMTLEASIENGSTHDLDWAEVEWDGPRFSAGVLPVGIYKTILDLKWPYVQEARLTFVDEKTRQPYSIVLSLKLANEEIDAGSCRAVTIRILDYDKAEIICRSPKKSGLKY